MRDWIDDLDPDDIEWDDTREPERFADIEDLIDEVRSTIDEVAPPHRQPHKYQPPAITTWRTCSLCGIGANGSIHKV